MISVKVLDIILNQTEAIDDFFDFYLQFWGIEQRLFLGDRPKQSITVGYGLKASEIVVSKFSAACLCNRYKFSRKTWSPISILRALFWSSSGVDSIYARRVAILNGF